MIVCRCKRVVKFNQWKKIAIVVLVLVCCFVFAVCCCAVVLCCLCLVPGTALPLCELSRSLISLTWSHIKSVCLCPFPANTIHALSTQKARQLLDCHHRVEAGSQRNIIALAPRTTTANSNGNGARLAKTQKQTYCSLLVPPTTCSLHTGIIQTCSHAIVWLLYRSRLFVISTNTNIITPICLVVDG